MKTYNVSFKLFGTMQIKAKNEEEARSKIDEISDRDILSSFDMDGDSIEVYNVEED
jgi:hypothetical protein